MRGFRSRLRPTLESLTRRTAAVVAWLFAASALLFPVAMLMDNIANDVPPRATFAGAAAIATQFVSFDDRPDEDAEYGTVVVSFGRFVPSEGSVDVQIRVHVPDAIKRGVSSIRGILSLCSTSTEASGG